MKEEVISCPKCGKSMIWVKNTLLCLKCDKSIVWDLLTPQTQEEQEEWLKNNRGV